jgi:transposase
VKDPGELTMTQRDRDRLVVLKKAQKKLITQTQAAQELNLTVRQVRRLLKRLKKEGDAVVIHGLRGRTSKRKTSEEKHQKIVQILSQDVYRGFGPTLASEYLTQKHGITIRREALRQIMMGAKLWRARKQKNETVHQWRQRRSCPGELVQWDTSVHDWLEGRGPKLYLIHMIDDASSTLTARFVLHDSTEENMRLLWTYLEQKGRPVAFYTDKASMFQTAPKIPRNEKLLPRDERDPLPPTQIGRALQELGIVWIAAHSPQAKGRVERSFSTAQDRLVKGLRVAGAATLEAANRYLNEEFVPWWNQHLVVIPANATDAHRSLGSGHDLAAILSRVETRQVGTDYTISIDGKLHRIEETSICTGLRRASIQIEWRLDGTLAARFRGKYLAFALCEERPVSKAAAAKPPKRGKRKPPPPSPAMRAVIDGLFKRPSLPIGVASKIDRTRTRQKLD